MRTDYWTYRIVPVLMALLLVWGFPVMAQEGAAPDVVREKASPEASEEGDNYKIGAGDLIQVVVWKNTDISGEFRVRPDGKFSMALIGDVVASGKTTPEISRKVEEALRQFIEVPFVSTIVREASSNRIYVIGEVVKPGVYPIGGSLTVLQALALAGGFTEFANREKLVLVRGTGKNQNNFDLSYNKILSTPGDKYNMLLQRGDTLVVR
jgi:polysaccharide export outer membrane protein